MKQLDLWAHEQDERPLTIGDVFECNQRWANGDSDLESLQHLARVLKGRREVSDWRVKPPVWYRVLDTRIEGDHVIATCRIVEAPISPARLMDGRDAEDDL